MKGLWSSIPRHQIHGIRGTTPRKRLVLQYPSGSCDLPFHRSGHPLTDHMCTIIFHQSAAAKIQKCMIKVKNKQRFSFPWLVHNMDSSVVGKLLKILSVCHML